MSVYEELHYKDSSPDATVDRLLKILHECGIDTEEAWGDKSSVDTYSLRVAIKETTIGTNGKGVTEEYARASAYAEFFERFQNGVLSHCAKMPEIPYYVANDEKLFTASEIVGSGSSFIDLYFRKRNMSDALPEEKVKNYKEMNPSDSPADGGDKYIVLPFYSIKDKKVVYLPFSTCIAMYGSNGMCAGNTPEEALVQGLSEIAERVAQKRIFTEKPALPTIPEEYIKKYPLIYNMYTKAKSNPDFEICLKDCSFGGKYPVVALYVIEKNTGRFGVKMGCHPNIGIAMERCFTEMTQGTDIFDYSRKRSWLDFSNSHVGDETNIINSYKIGLAQYPFQTFSENPDYPFTELPDVSDCSNAAILKEWINFFLSEHDVLVRDVSFTGFPSFYIIIPGLSEFANVSDYDIRVQNTRLFVSSLLYSPEEIDASNVKYIIGVLKAYNGSVLENFLRTYYPQDTRLDLPFDEIGSDLYLLSMCYVFQQNFTEAKRYLEILFRRAKAEKVRKETRDRLNAVYYYVSGRCVLESHKEVLEYLRIFFTPELCAYIDGLFKDPGQIIVKQYSNVILEKLPFYDDFRRKIADKYKDKVLDQLAVGNLFESSAEN